MPNKMLSGTVLDEQVRLSITEISQACSCEDQWVIELVEQGILEPSGRNPVEWHFSSESLSRAYAARRLQRDLGVNLAGVALALDLLEQLDVLRTQLRVQATLDT